MEEHLALAEPDRHAEQAEPESSGQSGDRRSPPEDAVPRGGEEELVHARDPRPGRGIGAEREPGCDDDRGSR